MKEYKYGKLVRMGNRNSKFSTDKRIEFIKCMRNAGVEIEILIEYMTLFERRIYIRSGTNNYNAKRYSA